MNIRVVFIVCLTVKGYLCLSLNLELVYFGKWLQNSNNENANVYTFEWIVKKSVSNCVDACKSTKVCQFINYEVRSHKCSLIRMKADTNNTNVTGIEIKPGCVFGNKSEWTLNKFSKCYECANQGKCRINGSSESEYNMCRNSGCEKIPDGTVYHGNSFASGSSVRLKCNAALSQNLTTCLENGMWNINISACLTSFFFNGSRYSIQKNPRTWHQAKEYCETFSGHLVDVNSEEEQKFLDNILTGIKDRIWTGGNDIEEENHFRWSDGSEFSAYTNWRWPNPDNYNGKEHCVHLWGRRAAFRWNDYSCNKAILSVCEFQ